MKTFLQMVEAMEDGGLMGPEKRPEEEFKYYMFFSNLRTIKKSVEQLLAMDPKELDAMLQNGHDWAADHIATSKDDIEEVCNWATGQA